jgi:hypothetical protein
MKPDMRARVSQLHKTEVEWEKLSEFIPYSGELIVFDPDSKHKYARLKVGDGITKLKDLPFFITSAIEEHATNNRTNEVIDAGRIR